MKAANVSNNRAKTPIVCLLASTVPNRQYFLKLWSNKLGVRKLATLLNKKGKGVNTVLVVLLVLSIVFPLTIQTAKANQNEIIVPDNFSTITAAITHASQGATILVKGGTYYENPVVNKSLSIIGEDPANTIVIGQGGVARGASAVFTLEANNVKLSGFTIESINYSQSTNYASGVIVDGNNCTISGNNIVNTYYGIFCSVQSSTTISQNNITANLKDGVRFCGGFLNTITGNDIIGNAQSGVAIAGYSNTITENKLENNGWGIGVSSSYSVVFANNLTNNSEGGFYFAASNTVVSANNIADNKYGVYFTSTFAAPNNNTFYHNNFVNNSQDVCTTYLHYAENWDNGFPSGGNYWSNYAAEYPSASEIDNSGIGNTTFTVYGNNTDRYPLIAPFNISNAGAPTPLPSVPLAMSNNVVALWEFNEVEPSGITPDVTGNNPAILGYMTGNTSYNPRLVDGKFGKALQFNGLSYVYVPGSPSLDLTTGLTIDAWINIQDFKNNSYNNIVVESMRTPEQYPTRIWGLAINGELPTNSSSVPQGALRGFIQDSSGRFDEVVTASPVVTLNTWIHVVFTYSLTTGLHIYVNGVDQKVTVTSGLQNPGSQVASGNEMYIGHDSISTIDKVQISNVALQPQASVVRQWEFVVALAIPSVLAVAIYVRKKRKAPKPSP